MGLSVRYCVFIQLDNSSDMARLREDVPPIVTILKSYSTSDEMVFRSNDGVLFGWFIETDKPIDLIRRTIEGSTNFRSRDSIMIIEVGSGLSARGFTRQWTWLQHSSK